MPYAIIETGSHQFRVEPGQKLRVELLDAAPGKPFAFDKVLLLAGSDGKDPVVGKPYVEKAQVTAEVLGEVRGPKVVNFRFRRRKSSSRKKGHRQNYTEVKILEIQHGA